jgi:hypothetical protein
MKMLLQKFSCLYVVYSASELKKLVFFTAVNLIMQRCQEVDEGLKSKEL